MYEAAEKAYRTALEKDPADIEIYLVLGGFYEAVGEADKAIATYDDALELHPGEVRLLQAVAQYYFKQRDMNKSDAAVAEILDQRPGYMPAKMLKGQILIANRQFNEAVNLFDQIIEEDPKSAEAHYFRGVAGISKGDVNIGKVELTHAVDLNPGLINGRVLLAELYFREKEFGLARNQVEKVLEILPDHYQATLILGNCYMYEKDYPASEKLFQKLIRLEPDNPSGHYRMGLLLRTQGLNDQALGSFEKVLALNPKLLDALINIVMIYVTENRYEEAVALCDKRLAADGDDNLYAAKLWDIKGGIYQAKKESAEAELSYKKAIQIAPEFMGAYYSLARLYISEKKTDDAVSQFNTILTHDPKAFSPHMLLGVIYYTQREFELAEKHYRAALAVKPDSPMAANNLAYLLAVQGKDLETAMSLAVKARELLPEDPNVMDTMGLVYYRKGLYDYAIGEFLDCS